MCPFNPLLLGIKGWLVEGLVEGGAEYEPPIAIMPLLLGDIGVSLEPLVAFMPLPLDIKGCLVEGLVEGGAEYEPPIAIIPLGIIGLSVEGLLAGGAE